MKKLILFTAFAMLSIAGYSQDSLNYRIHLIETKQYNAGTDLIRFHDQFKGSVYMIASGAAILGIAGIIRNNGGDKNIKASHEFAFLGTTVLLTGVVINIDSFKFIKFAGIDIR